MHTLLIGLILGLIGGIGIAFGIGYYCLRQEEKAKERKRFETQQQWE